MLAPMSQKILFSLLLKHFIQSNVSGSLVNKLFILPTENSDGQKNVIFFFQYLIHNKNF